MEHVITAKNTTVTSSIREYVERRFSKFDKYAPDNTKVFTKIEVKDNGKRHKVEVTIVFGKQTLRAESNDTDMYAAIDAVEKIMVRLLKKRKEKANQYEQRSIKSIETERSVVVPYDIQRTKTHKLLAMTDQEACEAMEMIGHPFYVYHDIELNRICAVYRREGDTCGKLIYE